MIRASLDESKISSLLSASNAAPYWRVRVISETSSTQDEIKAQLASNSGSHGDCVVTEFQSAGRGRLDRSFGSPAAVALLFSFYVVPQRSDAHGWIPLIAGMSVAQSLNDVSASTEYSNKWPNDVISLSGKVSGVLCEKYGEGIIVGIGINVSTQEEELPVDTASSIFITSGMEVDRNEVLPIVLTNFRELFAMWESGTDLKPRYRALCSTIGQNVLISLPGGASLEGRAINIGPQGELILESGDRISAGDITHLRSI